MSGLSARERWVWIAGCAVVTAFGWTLALVFDGMPTLALVVLGGVTTAAFGTGLTLVFADRSGPEAPAPTEMQVLLEDAERLRADTEKLRGDVLRALGARSGSGAATN